MILSHYSSEPFSLDREREYSSVKTSIRMKPDGLWLSDETDYGWAQWCQSENFYPERLAYETKISLVTDKIISIVDADQLLAFNKKFGVFPNNMVDSDFIFPTRFYEIKWDKVKENYSGIIITPYLWGLRLNGPIWYYGWDCASGCIWDLSVIDHVYESIENSFCHEHSLK